MSMSNAQVALTAAVASINSGDVCRGRDFVERAILARREEYLEWLNNTEKKAAFF